MSRHALPCIVCGKELLNYDQGDVNRPLVGIGMVSTTDNPGTCLLDDDDLALVTVLVNVCDTCMIRAAERGRVYEIRPFAGLDIPVPWWVSDEKMHRACMENERVYGAVGEDEPYAAAYEDETDSEPSGG